MANKNEITENKWIQTMSILRTTGRKMATYIKLSKQIKRTIRGRKSYKPNNIKIVDWYYLNPKRQNIHLYNTTQHKPKQT